MAARIGVDKVVEMRYMLRMLGVPMKGPSIMFGDNLAVINSSAIPDDTLKKRHNALSYHRIREAIAFKILKFYHINGTENPTDVLTNFLTLRPAGISSSLSFIGPRMTIRVNLHPQEIDLWGVTGFQVKILLCVSQL